MLLRKDKGLKESIRTVKFNNFNNLKEATVSIAEGIFSKIAEAIV